LFCDLVGSSEIAARLDPEEWRDLVAEYHRTAAEAINRYGGQVAKFLGDGVMAYFGWPEAHENDAERAARAGLTILDGVSKLNQESVHPEISVRVGIDSGTVVIGAGAGKEADVFGETPNIAARVQTAAAPDTVLITAASHRLLSGLFVVEDTGAHQLKGLTVPASTRKGVNTAVETPQSARRDPRRANPIAKCCVPALHRRGLGTCHQISGARLHALLRRPSDRAIGRSIWWSVHELVAASVEMARHCALGGLPAVFFV